MQTLVYVIYKLRGQAFLCFSLMIPSTWNSVAIMVTNSTCGKLVMPFYYASSNSKAWLPTEPTAHATTKHLQYRLGKGRTGKGPGLCIGQKNPQPLWQAGLQKEHLSGCSGGVLVSIHT